MSIWRAACERAGRTSARVPDATRCGGESSEAVITHKRLFGVCLVHRGSLVSLQTGKRRRPVRGAAVLPNTRRLRCALRCSRTGRRATYSRTGRTR